MKNEYVYNLSKEEDYLDIIDKEYKIYQKKGVVYYKDMEKCLSEEDFYPPADNRILKSYLDEAYDCEFTEYCEEFFDMLDKEGYYD